MMNSDPAKVPAHLVAAEPQLFVSNLAASIQFFQRLGFELVFAYGEPAFYAQVRRDGAALNLRLVQHAVYERGAVAREELLSASIVVDNVEGLYAEFGSRGVQCHQDLRTEPWGARTFIVCDPDGNLILFAGQ